MDDRYLLMRHHVVEAATRADVVVFQAPSGYGKTVTARQLVGDQPAAWIQPTDRPDEVELTRVALDALSVFDTPADSPLGGFATIGYLVAETARSGWIVLDDLHRVDEGLAARLVEVLLASRPPGLRLLISGRSLPLASLLTEEAAGRAVTFGPPDLELSKSECQLLLGDRADEVRASTGGWPLAVGLARSRMARRLEPLPASHVRELMAPIVDALDAKLHGLLTFLARFGVIAQHELGYLLAGRLRQDFRSFCHEHPALITIDVDECRMQDALVETLVDGDSGELDIQRLLDRLRLDGRGRRAAEVLVSARRWSALSDNLKRTGPGLIGAGRFGHLRRLVAPIPLENRSPEVELLELRSAMEMAKWAPDEGARMYLTETIDEALQRHDGAHRLAAAAVLVDHHRYHGDPRFGTVAFEALGQWANLEDLDEVETKIAEAPEPVASSLADLFGASALAAGLSGDAALAALSPVAYRLGSQAAARSATTRLFEAKNLHNQWALGFEDPLSVADRLGPVLAELRRSGHPHVVNRLNDRANLLALGGRHEEALRDCAEALDWGERTGNEFALQTARATRFSTTLALLGFDEGRRSEAELLWAEVAASDLQSRWLPLYAARVAGIALDLDVPDQAQPWLARMSETTLPNDAFGRLVGLELAGVELRLLVATGELTSAEAMYRSLRDDIERTGLVGLRRRLDALFAIDWLRVTGDRTKAAAEVEQPHQPTDLRRLGDALDAKPRPADAARPSLRIRSLAPTLSVGWNDEEVRSVTGAPAKLLAMLVADGGSTNIERCLEGLWPGADPDVARNRFHGVARRLRRKLGLSTDGPVQVRDGVVHLAETTDHALDVDAWRLDSGDPTAASLYADDFCAAQFPYDDFALEARRVLRNRYDSLNTKDNSI